MKKMIVIAVALAFAGAQVQTAKAGDREWATAGKILTGVAIGAVIASAANAHASYSVSYSSAPAYCPPPVVFAPPPRVMCAPPVVYVPPRVVCAPPPVVYVPRPVVVYRPPVVCAPPVVHVSYDRHGSHRYGHYDRDDRRGYRGHR